ncbi:MAG: ferric reductase-like transmembrane domain-containing protein [Elusimicrobia bacterium]|nr:ferric reductase-like transmembrane domain-containing protein [Elusimicrobiota bacterium]
MKKIPLFIFPAGVIAAIGLWLFNSLNSPVGSLFEDSAGRLLAFGRLAGILAALGILAQLLLISRVKWVEPLFRPGRRINAHHLEGLLIPLVLVLHPILVIMSSAVQNDLSFFAQCRNMLGWEGILAAAAGMLIVFTAVFLSLPAVKKRLNYKVWRGSHLLLYAALGLFVGHQLELGGDVNGNFYFAMVWYSLYGFVLATLAWCRFIKPFWLARKRGQPGAL